MIQYSHSRLVLLAILFLAIGGFFVLLADSNDQLTGNAFRLGWLSSTPSSSSQTPSVETRLSTLESQMASLAARIAVVEGKLNVPSPAPVPTPQPQKCCYYLATRSLSAGERTPYGSNYLDDTAARNFYNTECPKDSRQVSQAVCTAKDSRYTQFEGCRWRC